jgi:hypothetical protein
MQFTVLINQTKALEWGMSAQQAMLFAFIYQVPSWARPVVVGQKTFYAISKAKIVEELPLLTDKPDTAYRILKALELIEVIDLSSTSKITLIRITEKGREWNRSDVSPSMIGNSSVVTSDKPPTNQITNNQITNQEQTFVDHQDGRPSNDEILKAYQEVCGGIFKGAELMTPKRAANVKKLMDLKIRGQRPFREMGADFWKAYFTDCLENQHWRGNNDRGWKADFEFLTRPENVAKVLGV